MEYRPLGTTGLSVSALGFGASSLGGVFRPIDEPEGERAVRLALDHGINFIDVAPYYGATRAETVLGRALKPVPRDRYLLATKVGQYGENQFDFSRPTVTARLEDSLRRLGTDHVDLLQCHDIEFVHLDQIVHETLPALHDLKKAGKARHVGITGLPLKVFPAVIGRVPPGTVETVLSFCHYTLSDTSLEAYLPYFRARNIGVINAAPTSMGLLTDRGAPAWHPASDALKAGCRRAVDLCRSRGWNITELAVQFSVSHPAIATTLVGTASPQEMLDNVRAANTPPDPERLHAVLNALAPVRNHNFTRGLPENRDPLVP